MINRISITSVFIGLLFIHPILNSGLPVPKIVSLTQGSWSIHKNPLSKNETLSFQLIRLLCTACTASFIGVDRLREHIKAFHTGHPNNTNNTNNTNNKTNIGELNIKRNSSKRLKQKTKPVTVKNSEKQIKNNIDINGNHNFLRTKKCEYCPHRFDSPLRMEEHVKQQHKVISVTPTLPDPEAQSESTRSSLHDSEFIDFVYSLIIRDQGQSEPLDCSLYTKVLEEYNTKDIYSFYSRYDEEDGME